MLKRILEILGRSAKNNPASLSASQVIAAVNDLSQGNDKALQMAQSIVDGRVLTDEESLYAESIDEVTVFGTIAASLEFCGKLEVLDWAASKCECEEAFERLFKGGGVDVAEPLARFRKLGEPRRGDTVGLAYVAFRLAADTANMRILGLNANSDAHHLILVTSEVADRWHSVCIGDNQYIEDVDWQFKKLLSKEGIAARSSKHPSKNERPPPV